MREKRVFQVGQNLVRMTLTKATKSEKNELLNECHTSGGDERSRIGYFRFLALLSLIVSG